MRAEERFGFGMQRVITRAFPFDEPVACFASRQINGPGENIFRSIHTFVGR